jgi:hypothetical protein
MFNFRAKVKIIGSIFFVAILLSVAVLGGTRIISDSSDNSVTFITNSNGGNWDATSSNLQSAFDDLNNLSGWVSIPSYIPTSTTIKIPSNCDFFGFGVHTGLYLTDGSICNIIENYDQINGNANSKIRNMKLDGVNTTLNGGRSGIKLVNVTHCNIEGVDVYNVFWGIALYEGAVSASNEYNEIRSCSVDWCNSGIVIDGNFNTVDTCYIYNSSAFDFYARKSTIGHNYWLNIHGHGVKSGSATGEGLGIAEYDSPYQFVIGGSFYGNYPEDALHLTQWSHNSTITSVVVHNTNDSADGIFSSGSHVKFDDCRAYGCGGRGFHITGDHNTLDNIVSCNNQQEGILFGTFSNYSMCCNSEIYD